MCKSNFALAMSGMMVKQSWNAGGAALEGASWIPGPVGAGASVIQSIPKFIGGDWLGGAANLGTAALGLVGLNDIGKGIGAAGKAVAHYAPTLGGFAGKGMQLAGKGIQGGMGYMAKTPGLQTVGHALGPFRPASNWGATNSFVHGPNSVLKNTERMFYSKAPGYGTKQMAGVASDFLLPERAGTVQNMRAQAGQAATQHWGELNQFANSMSAAYGSHPPGELGPHNAALTASMGY